MKRIFKAAMYLRLSREDGEKEIESNSISNQRDMVMNFIVNRDDMEFISEYVDDGVSGFDFDRPNFDKMVSDVKAGKIDCIIVKDLSRLGRNFQKTEEFMQRNFPKLRCRFVAILNGYDSARELTASEQLAIPVANILNEYHVMETSRKIRDVQENNRRNGKLISGITSYGYTIKDKQIVIDPEAAETVKEIFALKISGMSNQSIANLLNNNDVACPLEHRLNANNSAPGQHFKRSKKATWSSQSVCRVLSDMIYTGSLVQGKTFSRNYKDRRRLLKDPAEWSITENFHEAIISETTFQIVADLLGKDNYSNSDKSYLFTGFAFCENCERPLYHRECKHKTGSNVYWQCMNRQCKNKRNINEKTLISAVHETLKLHVKSALESPMTADMIVQNFNNDTLIKELDTEIERIENVKSCLPSQVENGTITTIDYESMVVFYDSKIAKLNSEKESIIAKKQKLINCIDEITARFKKYCEIPELTREIVVTFIEQIIVENRQSIKIFFRYSGLVGGDENGS